jgi:hypothetical protein
MTSPMIDDPVDQHAVAGSQGARHRFGRNAVGLDQKSLDQQSQGDGDDGDDAVVDEPATLHGADRDRA